MYNHPLARLRQKYILKNANKKKKRNESSWTLLSAGGNNSTRKDLHITGDTNYSWWESGRAALFLQGLSLWDEYDNMSNTLRHTGKRRRSR